MKTTFLLIFGITLGILSIQVSQADDLTKSGTTAAQFLKIPIGARAVGMGGSYVALAKDVSSFYWNPAGLTNVGINGAASFSHTQWLADTQLNFAGAVVRAGNLGVIGLSFTSLSMPEMQVRTEFEPEGTGEYFSAMDMSLGLGYARTVTDRFMFGASVKYIREQIWHTSASSVAFDLGILFRTDFDWLVLGMSVANFGPKMQYMGKDTFINYDFDPNQWGDNENIFANLQTDYWDLPLLFRFGLAFEILKQEMNQLTAAIDALHPNDNTESVNLGLEYGFMNRVFLRGGYQSLFERNSEKGMTFGLGLVYYLMPQVPLRLDYAYADWGRLTNVHRLSVELGF